MKNLLLLFAAVLFSYAVVAQSCFSTDDDVLFYVVDKKFVSKDGKLAFNFGSSEAVLTAGSSTYKYLYSTSTYMGSGHKGKILLINLSGESDMLMYVSCRDKMMTDNKGTLLYEGGTAPSGNTTTTSNNLSTYKVGNLEVMKNDLGKMSWEDAKKACADLGAGWRLPTTDELYILNDNTVDGSLARGEYWSTEYDATDAYIFIVWSGAASYRTKTETASVRAVRTF